eukprot:221580_1
MRRWGHRSLWAVAGLGAASAGAVYVSRAKNYPSHYDHLVHTQGPPIPNSSIPTRDEQLKRLKSGEQYDVLVVGGGCVGSGVALDAVSRGLSVALVDRDDFASGTSGRSTKLIHGGVRYLEKAFKDLDRTQLPLIIDALAERRHLLSITPHLSYSMPIVVPMYYPFPEILFYLPYYWIGMQLYDLFAGKDGVLHRSYYMSKNSLVEKFPMLNERGLKGGIVYFDGMHNDARMNLAIALTAAAQGATVANHVEVVAFQKDEKGAIYGATLCDTVTGEQWDVSCKVAVNATGPFCDSTRKIDDPKTGNIIEPSAGTHVILPGQYSPDGMGMLIPKTSDGRVLFLLPWEGSTIAGTTDARCDITPLPAPTEQEVKFIIDEAALYLRTDLKLADVDAAWTGIRPLAHDPESLDTKSISRDHVISVAPSGLLTITGGKWTTYRRMSEDVVNRILEQEKEGFEKVAKTSNTTQIPLVGASGWSLSVSPALVRKGFPDDVATHLSHNCGDKALDVAEIALDGFDARIAEGYPYIEAEVLYATRHEYAVNTVDVISRRIRLALLNSKACINALPRVISLLADEHTWTPGERIRQFRDASTFLETMHVTSERRHMWHKRNPAHRAHLRIETLFGRSPLSLDQIRHLRHAFETVQAGEKDELDCKKCDSIPCGKVSDVINSFTEESLSHHRFRRSSGRFLGAVSVRSTGKIAWEDFLFSVAATLLEEGGE